jgi:SET domain-containing protein
MLPVVVGAGVGLDLDAEDAGRGGGHDRERPPGYGSLYNHSYRPNARYVDLAGRTKLFTAIRDIAAGEEITVNYNGEPGDETPVGFEVVECPDSSARDGSVDREAIRR